MKVAPVTFPPGRLKLATRPSRTGSPPYAKTIGIVVVAAFDARRDRRSGRENNRNLAACEILRKCRQTVELALCRTINDVQVAAFDEAAFLETRTKGPDGPIGHFTGTEQSQRRPLLRLSHGWPCRRQADQCDEFAPPHFRSHPDALELSVGNFRCRSKRAECPSWVQKLH
jgi:hypothetical protein